jgi:hypothetical protein
MKLYMICVLALVAGAAHAEDLTRDQKRKQISTCTIANIKKEIAEHWLKEKISKDLTNDLIAQYSAAESKCQDELDTWQNSKQ